MLTAKRKAISEKTDRIMFRALPVVILLALGYVIYRLASTGNWYHCCYFCLYMTGLVFSLLLLFRIYGVLTWITTKFCGDVNHSTGCDPVIVSRGAFILGDITWSDAGVIYFAYMLFLSLFPFYENILAYILSSFLAFPYIFYSLYYQYRIVRSWCLMCLIVQGILFLQFILSIFIWRSGIPLGHLRDLIPLFLLFLLTTMIYFTVKRLWKISLLHDFVSRQYHLFKFENLASVLFISDPLNPPGNKRIIFHAEAKNKITVLFRFTCTPCISHLSDIIETIKNVSNIAIEFIWCPGKKQVKEELPLMLYFASLYASSPTEFLKELEKYITDYPSSKKKYTNKWNQTNEIDLDIQKMVTASISWCAQYGIKRTPAYLLDERMVSLHYDFNDLVRIIDTRPLSRN